MELQITVAYIGTYQNYRLKFEDRIHADIKTGSTYRNRGYRFVIDNPFPRSAIKRIRYFKVFPTIREALQDACYDWMHDDGFVSDISDKVIYIEINEEQYYPSDIPPES